jgi:hypothetical protein
MKVKNPIRIAINRRLSQNSLGEELFIIDPSAATAWIGHPGCSRRGD